MRRKQCDVRRSVRVLALKKRWSAGEAHHRRLVPLSDRFCRSISSQFNSNWNTGTADCGVRVRLWGKLSAKGESLMKNDRTVELERRRI